jgi:hypothetical protein
MMVWGQQVGGREMPRVSAGKKQFNAVIDGELADQFRAWVEAQPGGLSYPHQVERMIRRHLRYPPPPPEEPPFPADERPEIVPPPEKAKAKKPAAVRRKKGGAK